MINVNKNNKTLKIGVGECVCGGGGGVFQSDKGRFLREGAVLVET